jgi:hypothetical protein
LKPNRNSAIVYHVIFGTMELNSPYLWMNGERSKPLIDDMGITHHGRTKTLDRALTDFGIEHSFEQASKRFEEHYGFKISPTTVDRVTKENALGCQSYVEERLRSDKNGCEPAPKPSGLSEPMLIELDGCEIRTGTFAPAEADLQDGPPNRKKVLAWRDVRVGLARPVSAESKLYVAQMEKYPEVMAQLFSVATMLGMSEKTEVVAVADGGQGLREGLENQFPNMQFILDKPHLKQHLYETAAALGYNEEQQRQWVHAKLDRISEGHAGEVLKELKVQNMSEPNDRLRQFIGYLSRFQDAVDYDRFKELGYPIGSGEVESAHRSIPQKRLKLPGACWHPDSINPILALRVIRANGWWDDYWANRTAATRMAA